MGASYTRPWTGRRVKKDDMRRIAKATGATIVTTLADMEGNETFDPKVLGEAQEVRQMETNRERGRPPVAQGCHGVMARSIRSGRRDGGRRIVL